LRRCRVRRARLSHRRLASRRRCPPLRRRCCCTAAQCGRAHRHYLLRNKIAGRPDGSPDGW
jgi:hypothetical protein